MGRSRGAHQTHRRMSLPPLTISVDTAFVAFICRKVVPAKIGNCELTKDVVEDRRRAFDLFVSLDLAGGLEACGGECVDEFLERDPVL
jgi:hypothetical protein